MQTLINNQIANADEAIELDNIKQDCDVQDGSFVVLQASNLIYDIAVYSNEEALIFEINEYSSGHCDISNISCIDALTYDELTLVRSHNFYEATDAREFVSKAMLDNSPLKLHN